MQDTANNSNETGATTLRGAHAAVDSLMNPPALEDDQQHDEPEQELPEGYGAEGVDEEATEEEPTAESSEADESEEAAGSQEEGSAEFEPLADDAVVSVNGEQMALGDLRKGYMQQQDYTRKTQELADQRRQFFSAAEEQAQTIRNEREQAQQELQRAKAYMEQMQPQEPDWNKLYQEDPANYAAQREAWRSFNERKQAIDDQLKQQQQQQQQQAQQNHQQQLQQEQQKLVEAIPEWNDSQTAQNERQRLMEWGQKVGISPDELGQVIDHRQIVVARKAMLYDELMAQQSQAQAKTRKKNSPKSAKPGAAKPKGHSQKQAVESARKRSRQSGRVNDAAALIQLMMPDEE